MDRSTDRISIAEKITEGLPIDISDSSSVLVDEKGIAIHEGSVVSGQPLYYNGEPVITTGRDVSYFVVDLRDDGDQSLTFRSIFLGTIFAGLGATMVQVRDLLAC